MTTSTPDPADANKDALTQMLARYENERLEHLRQIDLLQLEVKRHRQEAEDAWARAHMVQAAMDRHMSSCERDVGAIQRLRAELLEANARRKEQVAIIERRDSRIQSLLVADARTGSHEASAGQALVSHVASDIAGWVRRFFSVVGGRAEPEVLSVDKDNR
jgi:chromosome segregation ATPase